MYKIDIKKLINHNKERSYKKVFYDVENLKAQIVCLKSGQVIPPCKMNNDVLFYIIEGEGEIIVDSEKESLFPGAAVVVPRKAESRSISAKTDMIVLAVQGKNK